jgi:hypothetical protein
MAQIDSQRSALNQQENTVNPGAEFRRPLEFKNFGLYSAG